MHEQAQAGRGACVRLGRARLFLLPSPARECPPVRRNAPAGILHLAVRTQPTWREPLMRTTIAFASAFGSLLCAPASSPLAGGPGWGGGRLAPASMAGASCGSLSSAVSPAFFGPTTGKTVSLLSSPGGTITSQVDAPLRGLLRS